MDNGPEKSPPWEMEGEAMAVILRHRPDLFGCTLLDARAVLDVDYPAEIVLPRKTASKPLHPWQVRIPSALAYRKLADNCVRAAQEATPKLSHSLTILAQLYIRTAGAIEASLADKS